MTCDDAPVRLRTSDMKIWRLLIWVFGCGLLIAKLVLSCPASLDPACAELVEKSKSDVPIPLPPDCRLSTTVPPDDMVRYLEKERKYRRLDFKAWIVCAPPNPGHEREFPFERDPHWLESYLPRLLQFRRTAIILPAAEPIPRGSPVAGMVCRMPVNMFIAMISSQTCTAKKYSLWR
jgi:hypothetical protein